jgi:hypothetical protein
MRNIERRVKEIGCSKEELMNVIAIQEMVSDLFRHTKSIERCKELLRALAIKNGFLIVDGKLLLEKCSAETRAKIERDELRKRMTPEDIANLIIESNIGMKECDGVAWGSFGAFYSPEGGRVYDIRWRCYGIPIRSCTTYILWYESMDEWLKES